MGWCSGAELFLSTCKAAEKYIDDNALFEKFVRKIVDLFENYDADTIFDNTDNSKTGKVLNKIARERGYYDED